MFFTLALVTGVVAGSVLLFASRAPAASRRAGGRVAWPAWTSLALGAGAAATFALGVAGLIDTAVAILPGIALPIAGAVFGVGRLTLGDRCWQSWLGAVLSSVPALAWLAFAVAEIVGPAH